MKTNLRERLTRYRYFIRPKVHCSPLRNASKRVRVVYGRQPCIATGSKHQQTQPVTLVLIWNRDLHSGGFLCCLTSCWVCVSLQQAFWLLKLLFFCVKARYWSSCFGHKSCFWESVRSWQRRSEDEHRVIVPGQRRAVAPVALEPVCVWAEDRADNTGVASQQTPNVSLSSWERTLIQ